MALLNQFRWQYIPFNDLAENGEDIETIAEDSQTDQVLTMILVGKNGVGKKSTRKMILGEKPFAATRDLKSVRRLTNSMQEIVDERRVFVIDTPSDIRDSESRQTVQAKLKELVTASHCSFLIVLSTAMRFTPEDRQYFEDIFDLLIEEESINTAVVVFTGADHLQAENSSLEEYINGNHILESFLHKFGKRIVLFNNNNPTPLEEERQRRHLISIVFDGNEIYKIKQCLKDSEKKHKKSVEKKTQKLRVELESKTNELIQMEKKQCELICELNILKNQLNHMIEEMNQVTHREKQIENINLIKQREDMDQIKKREEMNQIKHREDMDQIKQREEMNQNKQREDMDQIKQREETDHIEQIEDMNQIKQGEETNQIKQREQMNQINQREKMNKKKEMSQRKICTVM